ncbi:class I SAM-dependent DNA methyltransferase [Shewanella woodyi]|uniref:Methyltransferase type 11 n=1 Tax=Shewanella woodyi (strain ATCC 51908 / MS32) TaxID=392500 RepID=B1KQL4_SHEWM|nr:class I SAM-dependent methyltransferase [Shewanella woodyi]ACA86253.1 Methyltransferase type 11 [Shewanella woodyi ATCC 51908]
MDKYKLSVNTFNKFAQKYQDKYMDLSLYDDTFELFCQLINQKVCPEIFEIACGPGNISRFLIERCDEMKLHGIDLAPNMVTLAKENNPNGYFEVMDCRDISQIDHLYDAIMCGFCLPYISREDAETLIKNSAKLLKKEGVIYLSTMEGEYTKSKLDTSSNGDQMYTHYHSAEHLCEHLESNGFTVLDIKRKTISEQSDTSINDLFIIAKWGLSS